MLTTSVAQGDATFQNAEYWLCVHDMFEQQAHRTPSAHAVVGLHRTLDYATLNSEAHVLAALIQKHHHQPVSLPAESVGDAVPFLNTAQPLVAGRGVRMVVGILMPHCEEYIIANLAIFMAGGAMQLLEVSYTPALLRELVEASGIQLVLTQTSMLDKLSFLPDNVRVFCVDGETDDSGSGSHSSCLRSASAAHF
jgi:acyl-CoA synthetase (AMP-forming)/AMP-acid ligase II